MPTSEADAIAIKAIISQSFDIWASKQAEREAEKEADQKRRILGGSIPAWVACVLSVIGIVMLAGGTNEKVNSSIRRIETLEAAERERSRDYTVISERLGNIEGKLDSMSTGRR